MFGCYHFAYFCCMSTGSTQESEFQVLLMHLYVVQVLVLPRKLFIDPFRRFRFYFEIYIQCPFHWCKKKWKFGNSGMYDVVSDHNFRHTFIHLDEVYLYQNSYYLWTILNSFFVNAWDELGPLNAAWLWSWKVPSPCKSRGRGLTQVLLFMGKTVSVTCYWIK